MTPRAVVTVAAATALALVAAYAALGGGRYEPAGVADPCRVRHSATTAATGAFVQNVTLAALDGAACELHVSREELALALVSERARKPFLRRHDLGAEQVARAIGAGIVRAVEDGGGVNALDGAELLRKLRILAAD